jgi:ribosomal protein S18 acetylase RimI-like enzyme
MLRPAKFDDAKVIAQVHVAAWQAAYKGLMPDDFLAGLSVDDRRQQWQDILKLADQVVLVCQEADMIVGFASAGRPRDQDLPETVAELYTIYLLPEVWSKGYGKAMYQEIISVLPEHGFTNIALWVLETNQRARGFYEAIGLKPDGQRKTETWQKTIVLHEVRYQGKLNHAGSPVS